MPLSLEMNSWKILLFFLAFQVVLSCGRLEIQTKIATIKSNKSINTEELCMPFFIFLTRGVWVLCHSNHHHPPGRQCTEHEAPRECTTATTGLHQSQEEYGRRPACVPSTDVLSPTSPAPASKWYLGKTQNNEDSIPHGVAVIRSLFETVFYHHHPKESRL